jgi:hypothetical protein
MSNNPNDIRSLVVGWRPEFVVLLRDLLIVVATEIFVHRRDRLLGRKQSLCKEEESV